MRSYAFMGKASSNAYKTIAYMTWPPPNSLHAEPTIEIVRSAAGGRRELVTYR